MPDLSKTNLSIKELYAQYWHCRDFEIQNLWQRSIFLGTFLILCFTGYGFFFCKAFFTDDGNFIGLWSEAKECCCNSLTLSPNWQIHIIAVFIAMIGIIMSVLWICLAKASKAWVEVYEAAIASIDTEDNFMPTMCKKVGGFHMEKLTLYGHNEYSANNAESAQFSNSLCSCKGGLFSPSKINICIGQISLVIWLLIVIVHIMGCLNSLAAFVITLAIVIGVIIGVTFCIQNNVKSGELEKKDPIRCYKNKGLKKTRRK